ncbi:hypothetical protein AO370_1141 [Moraxella catarrhalis]|uniref:Uncharacterized protein n=1 Tax=Moraxella catarrhalis TaxID=480 RepID=A0AB36DMS4_MORCA|nr:hypothetical protein AO370_1141 [Moraxella catarrhalis]
MMVSKLIKKCDKIWHTLCLIQTFSLTIFWFKTNHIHQILVFLWFLLNKMYQDFGWYDENSGKFVLS